jgi:CubicO group peptidase (beta-lactamase class C family)
MMKQIIRFYWPGLILIGLLTNACSFNPIQQLPPAARETQTPTQTGTAGNPQATGEINTALGEAIDAYIRQNHPLFSGAVLVASQGQVQLSKGYLWSDWELETLNRRSTKYRIASITKPITALAILMLQERGLLDVQDLICKYVPDCPQAWEDITIHQLLTHTSGIPDYTRSENALEEAVQPAKVEDLIARVQKEPLDFTPGERFGYSNSGYILLGYILEQVARRPYEVFLEENIFGPLNMQDSGVDNNRVVLKDRAHGFTIENDTILNGSYLNMTNAYAAGGLYSTVDDLFRLDQALYRGTLVTQDTLDEIFTPYVDAPDLGGQYGYGWIIGKTQGHAMESHEGRIFGFHALMERFPQDKDTIIILSNVESDDLERLRQGIENLLFTEE